MNKIKPANKWIYFLGVAILASFTAVIFGTPFLNVIAGSSGGTATVQSNTIAESASANQKDTKGNEEAIEILRNAISNGDFEVMSSAKQMQLQLQAGMTYEDGVLKAGNPLERRELENVLGIDVQNLADAPAGGFANPQVNDPALDMTTQRTQSETSIIKGSGNNMIAAYNDSGMFNTGGQVFTGFSTSTDGGSSWTDRGFIAPGAFGHFGDPVLAKNNTTGRIYQATLAGTTNGMNIFRSDDNGATWLPAVNGAPGTPSSGGDKEWIAVDNFPGAGNGNVYHAYRDFSAAGMRFTRSTNNGDTFGPSPGMSLDNNGQGAYVAVAPNHAVYYFYLDTPPNAVKVFKSTDQGVTFGPAVNIQTVNTTGTNGSLTAPAGYRTNAFPSIAINPVSGNIYVVHNDINVGGTDRGDIYFQQSTDAGATWSARIKVNMDAGTKMQATPAIAVTPDGTKLGITWYDNRNSPGVSNNIFERFGRVAGISGGTVSFADDFLIADAPSTPIFGQDPVVNSSYMGDYDSMDADNNFFYTTFVDTRLGASAGQDVRSAKFPATGPAPDFTLEATPGNQEICSPASAVYNVSVGSITNFNNITTLGATGNPGTAVFVPPAVVPPGNSVLTISGAAPGSYNFNITGTASGSPGHTFPLSLLVRGGAPATPSLTTPANGAPGVVLAPTFTWAAAAGATTYSIEVATDAAFTNIVASATNLAATTWTSNVSLNPNTQHFWRVRATNACGNGSYSAVFNFTTICAPTPFVNSGTITIPATGTGTATGAPANPYPSNITVAGQTGTISKVTVTIPNMVHTFPGDVDVLLVGPTGVKFLVVSDAINGIDWTGQTYTFDDDAAAILPANATTIPPSGSYRPTDHTAGDQFPAPAPVAPFLSPAPVGANTFATAFNGTAPNGTWSLYVVDDAGTDIGTFAGWTLGIATTSGCGSGTPTPTPTGSQTPTATPTATATPTSTPTASPTPCGTTTVSYTGPAVTLPDSLPAGVNVPIVVAGAGTITDVNFRFDGTAPSDDFLSTTVGVNHSWVGDLAFKLTSPGGTSVTFFDRPGVPAGTFGCDTNNLFNLTLDDDGGLPSIETFCPAVGPLSGNFSPNNPMSAFDGQNANGTWTLNASDNAGGDTGSLRAFSLIIGGTCGPTPSPTATPTGSTTPTATPTATATATPAGCAWTAGTNYPIAVADNTAVTIGSNTYVFGGFSNSLAVATANKFDGTTWTPIAPMPTIQASAAAVTDGTFAYILNGATTANAVTPRLYRYDPVANTYATMAPPVSGSFGTTAAYLNGKIYRIAGDTAGTGTAQTNTVEAYTIATNTWAPVANFPASVSFATAMSMNGLVYAGGGVTAASTDSLVTAAYDPATNTWNDAAIADLPATPAPHWGAASAVLNGKWVVGPGASGGVIQATAIQWDPVGNAWSSLPNATLARYRVAGAALNGSYYAVGGNPFAGTNTVQKLTCAGGPTGTPTATPTPTSTPTTTPTPTATPTGSPTPCGTTTVSYTGPAVTIPDSLPAGVNVPIVVAGAGTITDVNFRFDGTAPSDDFLSTTVGVNHSWVGDLAFKLTSPGGTSVTFFDRPGVPAGTFGCDTNNLFNLTLDDDGGLPSIETFCPAVGPLSGNFSPNNPMSAFDGQNANGTWTLNASDNAGGDTGSLRAFSLIIGGTCGPTPSPTATATATATPTATATATPTVTPTGTPTGALVNFSAATYTEDESQTFTTNLIRSGTTTNATSVTFATSNGTATGGAACTSGVDYISVNQLVTFNAGVTSVPVSVQLCADGLSEATFETVNMTITGADAGSMNSAVLRINDTANVYRNTAPIQFEIGSSPNAPDTNPYPSTITVVGGPAQIGGMRVTFYDLWHVFPDNVDVLLVGPLGQEFVVMGDSGGALDIDPLTPVTLTFQDVQPQVLPDNGPLTTGKFEPTTWESPVSNFAAPAPAGPYNEPGSTVGGTGTQTFSGTFGLTNANGTWSLYARDDAGMLVAITGEMAGGWGLEFLAPTAAQASISGRVVTSDGLAIRNAEMVLTGNSLDTPLRVSTSSFGYFSFDNLAIGETYVLTVNSRRFTFQVPSRVISLTDNAVGIDFVADAP